MPKSSMTIEKLATKKPAMELLEQMGYVRLENSQINDQRGKLHNVVLKDILAKKMSRINKYEFKGVEYSFSDVNIETSIKKLDEPLSSGLIEVSRKILKHLRLGVGVVVKLPDGRERTYNMQFIDWNNFEKNDFYYVEEYMVESFDGRNKRPIDVVIFINGIPFSTIECKRPSEPVNRGVEQTIEHQNKNIIPQLYKYCQILLSTNKNQVKYGTTASDKEFWSEWKEQDEEWLSSKVRSLVHGRFDTVQDRTFISLLDFRAPEGQDSRLYEFFNYFIIYEGEKKIIARYNQYFAVKEILQRALTSDETGRRVGGTMYQTQGSGKSLEMVIATRYLLDKLRTPDCNPRVIIVTDRVDLDEQLTRTFDDSGVKSKQAQNGRQLAELVADKSISVVSTLVHKFKYSANVDVINDSTDIFVFVDEAHRTQYDKLYNFMRDTLKKACYIGFTGTPLMRDAKKNTLKQFGDLYDSKYTMVDGVEDGAVVRLLYEGRTVEQEVRSESINAQLEKIIAPLNEKQQELLKQKWSEYSKVASSSSRIKMITFDINEHFVNNLKGSGFKAILATERKLEAVRYLEEFNRLGDVKAAVVISPPDTREGHDKVDESKDKEVINFWNDMMGKYISPENYEKTIKQKFKKTDEIDILIVVDKLLTGFDAPRAQVLYLDKITKEHNLLQAIARVNRVFAGKDYGYIVDYRGLLTKLDEAMNIYAGAGLEDFDPEDLKGTIYDVKTILGELRTRYAELTNIFNSVLYSERRNSDLTAYERVLEDEKVRNDFYKKLNKFANTLGIVFQSYDLYSKINEDSDELKKYEDEFKFYQNLRQIVRAIHFEKLDNKEYEPKIQRLMDNYIFADDPYEVVEQLDIFDLGFEKELKKVKSEKSKADMIKSRLEKRISIDYEENPSFYKKFKERIEETLEKYRQRRIDEAQYFAEMYSTMNDFRRGDVGETYPDNITGKGMNHERAFYGSIKSILEANNDIEGKEELLGELAMDTKEAIAKNLKRDWIDNTSVQNRMEQELDDLFYDFAEDNGFELELDDIDLLIDGCLSIAKSRMKSSGK